MKYVDCRFAHICCNWYRSFSCCSSWFTCLFFILEQRLIFFLLLLFPLIGIVKLISIGVKLADSVLIEFSNLNCSVNWFELLV